MSSRQVPKIHYPWADTPKGGGFFVPTLDTELTIEHGEKSSLHFRYTIKTVLGVLDGKYGVLFIRRR